VEEEEEGEEDLQDEEEDEGECEVEVEEEEEDLAEVEVEEEEEVEDSLAVDSLEEVLDNNKFFTKFHKDSLFNIASFELVFYMTLLFLERPKLDIDYRI
jgi:hypothetical protein